jgi:hypothetical protein
MVGLLTLPAIAHSTAEAMAGHGATMTVVAQRKNQP